VYHLTDGRFAVITGPITMNSLLDQSGPEHESVLQFWAFMEINGKMYLDEIQAFCASDVVAVLNGERVISSNLCF
jgi:hypothetical protein